jgi:ATP/maltotriose-dependent transcriptional regulator MalT
VIQARGGNPGDALRTLIEGVDVSQDASLTLEMLHEASEAAIDAGEQAVLPDLGDRAARLQARTPRDEFNQAIVVAFAALVAGEYDQARARFDAALRLSDDLDDARAQVWAACAASVGLDPGAGLPFAARAVELARMQGLLSVLPVALDQQAAELFRNSNFDLAYAAAEEGYRLSLDLGQGPGCHLETIARVEAVWGRETDAREHAAQVIALAQQGGDPTLAAIARAVIGLVELSIGRPDQAADALLEAIADERGDGIPIVLRTLVLDVVEAVVRAGRDPQLVNAPIARYRKWVTQAPTKARRSTLALCEAVAGERPPDDAFTEALAVSRALPPFHRARGELLYGEWLRRQRRRTDARVHLRTAADLFRAMGAAPWEKRAEAELRATGETARKRDPSTMDDLTAQELQIAGLVADGLTNREIAAQLFISPRTVEYHLGKVFSKLAIGSRSELIRNGPPRREAA